MVKNNRTYLWLFGNRFFVVFRSFPQGFGGVGRRAATCGGGSVTGVRRLKTEQFGLIFRTDFELGCGKVHSLGEK